MWPRLRARRSRPHPFTLVVEQAMEGITYSTVADHVTLCRDEWSRHASYRRAWQPGPAMQEGVHVRADGDQL